MRKKFLTNDLDLINFDEEFVNYDAIDKEKEKGSKEMNVLTNVIGHNVQKKELIDLISWFNNSKELKEKGISIPHGAILFGEPGNGKSLLIRELIKTVDCPVFIFAGEKNNPVEELNEVFKKAKDVGHSIIVIDELDLLISREARVIRTLQENIDGVDSSNDILVLAATNDLDEIPDALQRNGRLEKIIHVPFPTDEESVKIFEFYLKEFNLSLPKDFDEEEMGLSLHRISCAGIKSIVNDIVLRNGFVDLTTKMIDDSIFNVTNRIKHTPTKNTFDVAIHESAHALIANKHKEFFYINKLNIDGASGCFVAKEVDEDFWSYKKCIADIQICYAGCVGQKMFCQDGSRGSEIDLDYARKQAYNLFNRCGYSTCWETLPKVSPNSRVETFIKRRKMERKIEKFLRKQEKEVRRYLMKHKKEVFNLAKLLFEKKHLKSKEILACINNVGS